MKPDAPALGIDLGGSKIEARLFDAARHELWRERIATPQDGYGETLAAIAGLVGRARVQVPGAAPTVGIGTPGSADAAGRIKNANSTCLNGQPLKEDLEGALAREVRLANDANCFALSEAIDGAGRDARVVFGVILGTGTGGGLVVNGRLVVGANAIAGEWGHNPLPAARVDERPGPACYCGRLLNNVDHKDTRVITERSASYGDAVMFTMIYPFEFRAVQAFYPILFHRDQHGEMYPVALFGFEAGENLFLDDSGWHARYVPAMIRRQPFLIGFEAATRPGETEQRRMLSLDMAHPRVSTERGEPLFQPLGGRTPFLEEMASLLETLYHGGELNRRFVQALQEHGLIENVTFDIALADGSRNQLLGSSPPTAGCTGRKGRRGGS